MSEKLRGQVDNAKFIIEEFETSVEVLELNAKVLKKKLRHEKARNRERETKIESLEEELKDLEDKFIRLEDEFIKLENENQYCALQYKSMKEKLGSTESQSDELTKITKVLQQKNEFLESELRKHQSELSNFYQIKSKITRNVRQEHFLCIKSLQQCYSESYRRPEKKPSLDIEGNLACTMLKRSDQPSLLERFESLAREKEMLEQLWRQQSQLRSSDRKSFGQWISQILHFFKTLAGESRSLGREQCRRLFFFIEQFKKKCNYPV